MHLLDRYSQSASNAKVGKAFLLEEYIPLPFDEPYLHIHVSTGLPSKNYDYWQEVLDILYPYLKKYNVKVVQTGGPKDRRMQNTYDLRGVANVNHTAFLIKNALLHMSGNTFSSHVAGMMGTPYVTLYGVMPANCSKPYWGEGRCLEADFEKELPSYVAQEPEKRINEIMPEQIAQNVIELLGWEPAPSIESLYFGKMFLHPLLEVIPNFVIDDKMHAGQPMNIRMDYFEDPVFLPYFAASDRKLNIRADSLIDIPDLIELNGAVKMVHFNIDQPLDDGYISELSNLGIEIRLTSELKGEDLRKLRLKMVDYEITAKVQDAKRPDNLDIRSTTQFKTNKMVIANNKHFLSKAHYKADEPSDVKIGEIIEDPVFWEDLDFFYLFNG